MGAHRHRTGPASGRGVRRRSRCHLTKGVQVPGPGAAGVIELLAAAPVFDAFGDPNRLRIVVRRCDSGASSTSQVTQAIPVNRQAATKQHTPAAASISCHVAGTPPSNGCVPTSKAEPCSSSSYSLVAPLQPTRLATVSGEKMTRGGV
jgi:hypothetical protein